MPTTTSPVVDGHDVADRADSAGPAHHNRQIQVLVAAAERQRAGEPARATSKRGPTRLGQAADSALDRSEPAIDIAVQDLGSLGSKF